MRVFVDDQIFTSQVRGGVSRYFVELMRAFRTDATLGVEVTNRAIWTKNEHLAHAGMGRSVPLRTPKEAIQWANRRARPLGPIDVLHHTYYDPRYLSGRWFSPKVRAVTVYDMIPEIYPDMFPMGNPHKHKREFVDRADLILTISEATKRDLCDIYGVAPSRIAVTPLGVAGRFAPSAPKSPALPRRYVLYVGSRRGYKDFDVLARAFAGTVLAEDVHLVMIGGGELTESEAMLLDELGIYGRVVQRTLDDIQLVGAYAHALAFVFPSRREGFGLPTLEAMASGCPTVLADSSAHPEVGGNAALYFGEGDHADLSKLLVRLEREPQLRTRLRESGLARAAMFSWSRTAAATAGAYRRALDGALRPSL